MKKFPYPQRRKAAGHCPDSGRGPAPPDRLRPGTVGGFAVRRPPRTAVRRGGLPGSVPVDLGPVSAASPLCGQFCRHFGTGIVPVFSAAVCYALPAVPAAAGTCRMAGGSGLLGHTGPGAADLATGGGVANGCSYRALLPAGRGRDHDVPFGTAPLLPAPDARRRLLCSPLSM